MQVGCQLHASAGVTRCSFDSVACGFRSRTGRVVEDKNLQFVQTLHLLLSGMSK